MGALEKLIDQKKFKDDYQRASIAMLYLANVITNENQDCLKPFGISLQQYNALRILRGCHPREADHNYIRQRLIDKYSDVSRLIERMQKKQWIECEKSEVDKRKTKIFISKKGLDLLAKIDTIESNLSPSIKSLEKKDVLLLADLLDKLLERQLK